MTEDIRRAKEEIWVLAEQLEPWEKLDNEKDNNDKQKDEQEPVWKATHREMKAIIRQRNLEWYKQEGPKLARNQTELNQITSILERIDKRNRNKKDTTT